MSKDQKSKADLKHELLTMQVQATQQMASNDQQRRLEIEELASQLRMMRDANAGILRQEQEAVITARALAEATAEHAYTSAEHKLTMTNRELESDRELHATSRLHETQLRDQLVQVETHANEHFARLSGALRSTEEGQVVSVTQTRQMVEEHYRHREAQQAAQWQAEWAT